MRGKRGKLCSNIEAITKRYRGSRIDGIFTAPGKMAYQANVIFFNDGIGIGECPLLCQFVSVLMAYESTFAGAINL